MPVMEDLQEILGDNISTNLLTIYIRKATTLINKYVNNPLATADNTFDDAVIEYVTICANKRGNEGLATYTQGGVQGSYVNDLPNSVKSLLPLPFVKMR